MMPRGQRYTIDSVGERKANILAEMFNYTSGSFEVRSLFVINVSKCDAKSTADHEILRRTGCAFVFNEWDQSLVRALAATQ